MAKHEELILCKCHSTDHQLIFLYDDDPDWDRVYLHIHLNPDHGFWRRLKQGLKYAFGFRSRFGDFDEIILRPEDADKIQNVAKYLKEVGEREENK